jgi:hypothetical protein
VPTTLSIIDYTPEEKENSGWSSVSRVPILVGIWEKDSARLQQTEEAQIR